MKVKAKKELGQHFLTDESIARRIVDAALETLPAVPSAPASADSNRADSNSPDSNSADSYLAKSNLAKSSSVAPASVASYSTSTPAAPSPAAFSASASPAPASPTSTSSASASPTPASPASASPTSVSPASASPASASPASASPASASPASASPTSVSPAAASSAPGSSASASPTSASPALLEIGPGTGVLTKYLLAERDRRPDFDLKLIEIDPEAAAFLRQTYPSCRKILFEEDFLQSDLSKMFAGDFCVVGNFPYNISSQIFFKLLDCRDRVPAIVGMLQKEVAERLASKPGKKAYGVLSVLLQTWYDIEYLFEVGNHCFNPQPKVQSAVIRLRRNSRTELPCDEMLFKKIVKTGFNQRRKTLRNSLRPLLDALASGADVTRFNAGDGSRSGYGTATRSALASRSPQHNAADTISSSAQHSELGTSTSSSKHVALDEVLASKTMDLRPEQLSVEDYIALTNFVASLQHNQ